ncbi:ASCH domain-containing protein [Spirosoma endbachense]|uniref:ASCH domain-containing protein n=1 Tax=Spirosoma endbachense TaxID=2666025 RepID=A0A6P1W1H0_9BACT|nr:hypothetical protein [Spirosoma endbachense]QHV99253.1 hypothetical protein GJR95_31440 [Spirosoma endbachense]
MRIITLYQPYATLMMLGLKTNETRNRRTLVRGTLGIHAAAAIPNWCRLKMNEASFKSALKDVELPTGKILGTVELIGSMRTEEWLLSQSDIIEGFYTAAVWNEIAFGDYSANRWAWQTINPTPFETPIPAKGSQGFWFFDLPNEVIQQD